MKIQKLTAIPLEIPFKVSFKHASADRAKTSSIWVEAYADTGELIGYGEGCPREYVTGETLESAFQWLEQNQADICKQITNLESLKLWMRTHKESIDQHPSAWCAVELALLDLFGKNEGRSLESLLSLPLLKDVFQYSAVLGDGELAGFAKQVEKYLHVGFRDFKIKLSGNLEKDIAKITCLSNSGAHLTVRADANNLWRDPQEVITYLERLGHPFWGLEEPLAPRNYQGMKDIAQHSGIKIILDESFTNAQNFSEIQDTPDLWVLNLRVSKLGGLLRSLDFLNRARSLGMKVNVGAHVGETSVLTRAGLTLVCAASDNCVAMEGAFGTHLLEQDVCTSSLMFGKGGKLIPDEWNLATLPGNGLKVSLSDKM